MKKADNAPTVRNRKAWHDYHVEETVEAGLMLVGTEVKSVRAGKVQLTGGFVVIEDNEAWLVEVFISPYEQASSFNVDPRRRRKLLLNRREIDKMMVKVQAKGMTLMPLAIYFKRGYAKLEVGICRGKREFDKRDTLREREADREKERAMSSRRYDD
ncbi:MAG: SsrA-binding protein SmpB [Armatimonadetes bacterium]|nr:SsrA-binding protein SmpB [Armatimonadota bacterium]